MPVILTIIGLVAAAAHVARCRASITFFASVFGGMAAGIFAIQQSNP